MTKANLANPRSYPKICSVEGCGKPFSCKGYCASHYSKFRPRPRCIVPDCLQADRNKGYCSKHAKRLRKYGDLDTVILRRAVGNTPEERFWSLVDKTEGQGPNGDCWGWHGKLNHYGYATILWMGKAQRAHRISWMLANGRMSDMFILHSCDNRACTNPAHLREGTLQENTRDMVERNRQARGERAGNVKLTQADIEAIRTSPKYWGFQSDLAKRFGLNSATVSRIRRGKSWKHVQI